MTTLTLTVDDTQIIQAFNSLGAKLGKLSPLMSDLGAILESRVNQRFALKVDPTGQAWADWAPSTAKARAKSGRGTLLEYTRRMLDSLNHNSGADWLEIGFGVPYAAAHEFGAHIQRAASSREVYFKQGKDGAVGNRFVKKSKSNFAQRVQVGAHEIDIPPRRMLTADGANLGAGDQQAILRRISAWLAEGR